MRIFKRGKFWWIDYIDGKGDRHRESTHSTQKRQAEEMLIKRKDDIRDGKFGIERPEQLTFNEFKEEFIEYCRGAKKRNTTLFYEHLMKPLGKAFGDMFLDDITPYLIEQYKSRRQQKVSKSTVNRELSALNHIYASAVRWKKAVSNPAEEVEKLEEPKGRIRFLNLEELALLLDACLRPYLLMAVELALHTGMRKGEILALRKENVDIENCLITVAESRTGSTVGTPKSGKHRYIPINDYLLPKLIEWIEGLPEGQERLFPMDDFKGSFNAAVKRAGLMDFTFHDLRHTFASYLVMGGKDITTVSALLGHASIQMTQKYAHLSPDHKKAAVDYLSEIFSMKNKLL